MGGEGPTTFGLAPTQAQTALASVVKAGLSGLLPRPFLELGPEGHPAKTNCGCWVECSRVAAEQAQIGRPVIGVPVAGSMARGPPGSPGTGQARSRYQEATGHLSAPVE